jgi:hypothetical protein
MQRLPIHPTPADPPTTGRPGIVGPQLPPVLQPVSGPAAAEQQAAEQIGLSRVLRLCSRRKAACGVGATAWVRRHAAAAIIQLCRGPQPVHQVHQLQATLGAGAAAGDAEAALLLPGTIRLLLQAAAARQPSRQAAISMGFFF